MALIRRLSILAVLLSSLCACADAALTEMRTWKDEYGREIDAVLLRYNPSAEIGEFRRIEGMTVKIPLRTLSAEDQAFLLELTKEPEKTAPQRASVTQPAEAKQSANYDFSKLSKTTTVGYIATKEGWEYRIDALMVRLSYRGNYLPASQYVKAYFYDRHKELIEVYGRPARTQNEDETYSDPPTNYLPKEKQEVYFPLSKFLEDRDWRRAIIVFGDANEATAKIYPSGKLEEYPFKERHLIFGSQLKPTQNQTNEEAPKFTEFTISSAREKTYPNTAWVNGDWSENNRGILAEVKVSDKLPRGKYVLLVHYFDANNRIVHTQYEPAEIEVDEARNQYSKRPKFADLGEKYEVFFPYDRAVERVEWRKAVIIFGDRNSIDVDVIGGNLDSLDELDFPEKPRYKPKDS